MYYINNIKRKKHKNPGEYISYKEMVALWRENDLKPTYNDLLLTSEWRVKREEILFLQDNKCQSCSSVDNLEVHHTYYVKGRLPWQYPDHVFIVLCDNCHDLAHDRLEAEKYNHERLNEAVHISEVFKILLQSYK